jgi:SAM-dependent methyltransferase
VDGRHRESADRARSQLERGLRPRSFRDDLLAVPPIDRDAWVDRALGLDAVADDGPELPRGCVPYLPCSVDSVVRVVEHAPVVASDVFVDVGSGVGRAGAIVHLLTGARVVGLEIQADLVRAARDLAERLDLRRVESVQGDAAELAGSVGDGSVFFLYCPFAGARLERLLASLEGIARTRPIRVCCVDLPLPPCAWLARDPPRGGSGDVGIYRSGLSTARGPRPPSASGSV